MKTHRCYLDSCDLDTTYIGGRIERPPFGQMEFAERWNWRNAELSLLISFSVEVSMGTGGSRFGAGRPAYRAKAEQLQRVEIGRWHRGGYLREGASFTWSWNRGGEPTGNIGVRVFGEDSLILQYQMGSGDEWRDGTQAIRIDRTPCNYGKTRPWFGCPVCQRRAGVLYLRAGRFACRQCQRVSYSSQSCDQIDRTWRKQSKLEARLGDNWTRPKGMRHATHERLIDALCDCEERRDAACTLMVGRLFGVGGLRELGL